MGRLEGKAEPTRAMEQDPGKVEHLHVVTTQTLLRYSMYDIYLPIGQLGMVEVGVQWGGIYSMHGTFGGSWHHGTRSPFHSPG